MSCIASWYARRSDRQCWSRLVGSSHLQGDSVAVGWVLAATAVRGRAESFPIITRQAFVLASELRGGLRRDHPGARSAGEAFVQGGFSSNARGNFENPSADWRTKASNPAASRISHGDNQGELSTLSKPGTSPWPSPGRSPAIHPNALIFQRGTK